MAKGLPTEFETASTVYVRKDLSLGQGGVGTVFEVADADGNKFALKLFTSASVSRQLVKRFENELRFLLANRRPHLVPVVDNGFVFHAGRKLPFYVMPVYAGTLRNLISKGIPAGKVVGYFKQILEGVGALHRKASWHRDLKPENILFDEERDTLFIADLGAAHFAEEELHTLIETKPTSRMANFRYSAPEQREQGRPVDQRADIFALGLLLNEMFTGEVAQGRGHKLIGDVDTNYSELDEVVDAMIQQEPDNRPGSIDQVLEEMNERGFSIKSDTTASISVQSEVTTFASRLPPSIKSSRVSRALASGDAQSVALVQDYFEKVEESLTTYDYGADVGQLDTALVRGKIDEITPLRDEVINVIVNIARHRATDETYELLHDFFERLIPFINLRSNSSWAADHYKLFASELFLYATAATLKWRRFPLLNILTDRDYFVRPDEYYAGDSVMTPFYKFATYSEAMHWFNKQPGQKNYYSPQGQLIKDRSSNSIVDFEDLKQADLVLYLLFNLDRKTASPRAKGGLHWYPRLAPYFAERYAPFELFARSESHTFFESFRVCMRNTQKDDLVKLIQWLKENRQDVFNDGGVRINLDTLMNIERLERMA